MSPTRRWQREINEAEAGLRRATTLNVLAERLETVSKEYPRPLGVIDADAVREQREQEARVLAEGNER